MNVYSAGEQWHQQRKFLTPAFHFKILNGFAIIMNECAAVCANKLKEHLLSSGNKEITLDICPLISLCTLDIICETSMGKKLSKLFKQITFIPLQTPKRNPTIRMFKQYRSSVKQWLNVPLNRGNGTILYFTHSLQTDASSIPV
jgi:cytochrome P450